MHQAASKSEERFARVAIRTVLLNSVLDILSRERVLEFGGENWQAIEEEYEIQTIIVSLAITLLANFAEYIRGIEVQ
jgi:hypothetical protein